MNGDFLKKVIVEIAGDIKTFKCSSCKKLIVKGESFIIDKDKNQRFKCLKADGNIYYKCTCGARFELIKYSSHPIPNGFKFKQSVIVEDYLF